MSLLKRVYDDLEERRERVLSGKVNCIPWGLPRFEEYSPGIEQGRYYLMTANSKVGKSQGTDWLFMYNPFKQMKLNKLPIKLKIFYFSLEMSKEEKLRQMMCNLLFLTSDHKTVISPKTLRSTKKAIDQDILDKLRENEEYIDEFLECVTFIDNIRNPFGIYKFMRDYALKNGTQHFKTVQTEEGPKKYHDYYEASNPEEYVMCIVDHAKLLSPEKGGSLRDTIGKLSSDYFIILRNMYNHIPILVQQQSAAQESIDNARANKLRPTLDGLGDNKTTQQDANLILGLFSPFRHQIADYEGYDIKFYKDNIRFLEILGGREGGAGVICPLYFNGAVNYFREMPDPNDMFNINAFNKKVTYLRNAEREQNKIE